ncbi:MAG: hypothetical protein QM755_05835 [Luteolibacter sp.]
MESEVGPNPKDCIRLVSCQSRIEKKVAKKMPDATKQTLTEVS